VQQLYSRDLIHPNSFLYANHVNNQSQLFLLRPCGSVLYEVAVGVRCLHEVIALNELEYFVDETNNSLVSNESGKWFEKYSHDGCTDTQYRLPFRPVERDNAEQALQEWDIEQSEMQRHTQANGID
jgi:hypothetical protein